MKTPVVNNLGRPATRGWLALTLLALPLSCGDVPIDGDAGDVTVRESALLNINDFPPAAAVSVKHPSGTVRLWVFACDSLNRLRLRKKTNTTWSAWQTVANGCTGVPTVGKWTNGSSDTVLVYARKSDAHLWEFWYPDADGAVLPFNLSASLGYSDIRSSPTIADSDGTGRVSVAIMVGPELYTFDWYSNAWHARPVLWGGSVLRNSSYTNANYETGVPFLSGKGFPPGAGSEASWVATRGSWSSSFKVTPAGAFESNGVPGLGGGLWGGRTGVDPTVTAVQTSSTGWISVADPTVSPWTWSQLEGCVGPGHFDWGVRNPGAGATNHLYGNAGAGLGVVSHDPGGVAGCGLFSETGLIRSGAAPVVDGQTSIWPASSFSKHVLYKASNNNLTYFNPTTRVATNLGLVPAPPQ